MHRLRKWQERIRTKDAGERNLQFALSEIDRMASALGVPRSVREVASVIYRRSLAEDLIRGRSIEGVATSALYAACRKEGIPRSLEEISEVSRVERKEIGRTYRYVSQELSLEMRPVDPKKYVPRFCSELTLSEEVQSKANDIIETTAEKGLLSGKSPTGYAAAAIYAASLLCNEKKTQREVADVAQVTEVTIRNRYQEQIEAMGIHELETSHPPFAALVRSELRASLTRWQNVNQKPPSSSEERSSPAQNAPRFRHRETPGAFRTISLASDSRERCSQSSARSSVRSRYNH